MRFIILCFLAILYAPAAAAQMRPVPQDHSHQDRLRHHAEVFQEYQQVLRAWAQAWSEGDVSATARFYMNEATLLPSGEMVVTGLPAIERALHELVPQRRDMRTGLTDFEVRGNMLFGLGAYSYETPRSDGSMEMVKGSYVVVMVRVGRSWRIRSQVFVPTG